MEASCGGKALDGLKKHNGDVSKMEGLAETYVERKRKSKTFLQQIRYKLGVKNCCNKKETKLGLEFFAPDLTSSKFQNHFAEHYM